MGRGLLCGALTVRFTFVGNKVAIDIISEILVRAGDVGLRPQSYAERKRVGKRWKAQKARVF